MGSGVSLDFGIQSYSPPWGSAVPAALPSTQTFGPTANYPASGGMGDWLAALNPLRALGMSTLAGVFALGGLVAVRQTMPPGGTQMFDRTIIIVTLFAVAVHGGKFAANRWKMHHEPGSITKELGTAMVGP